MLFSSCSEQGFSRVAVCGLLIAEAPLVGEHRPWSTGSVAVVQGLSAPHHLGSSQTRDQPCISCIDRWILIHWAIRGGPNHNFLTITVRYVDCKITYFLSIGSFRLSLLVPSFSSTIFGGEFHSFSNTYSSHLTWGSDSVVLPFFHLIPLVNPVSVCLWNYFSLQFQFSVMFF